MYSRIEWLDMVLKGSVSLSIVMPVTQPLILLGFGAFRPFRHAYRAWYAHMVHATACV
jgi:hypothetical protein